MKKSFAAVLLLGLLTSMAAAQSNNNNNAKKAPANTAAKAQDFDGWVSDERCGAKVDAECSKKCLAQGAKLVFVSPDRTVVPVANQDVVKSFVGQHVTLKGKLDNGILTVNTIKSAAK